MLLWAIGEFLNIFPTQGALRLHTSKADFGCFVVERRCFKGVLYSAHLRERERALARLHRNVMETVGVQIGMDHLSTSISIVYLYRF
jgi:hypothetical protein